MTMISPPWACEHLLEYLPDEGAQDGSASPQLRGWQNVMPSRGGSITSKSNHFMRFRRLPLRLQSL
ncbi:MAG: hypothetical protein KME15_03090 [Drouetiella hepatica Uher 2000/2452]|uniref:Uncharacterized protein n=1 Tax=Drouetiella hepatica Uher 2000/2452 TaxID=904376 RepID=A0A951QA86_9CYAN|nr:hypothetical protein [Drouetiella hepatica Uher 2000/2452]